MNAERLLHLADHLEKGELGHFRFDFGSFNSHRGIPDDTLQLELQRWRVVGGPSKVNNCGTIGCALGECPFAFPDQGWSLYTGDVFLNTGDYEEVPDFTAGSVFFDISLQESEILFSPYEYLEEDHILKIEDMGLDKLDSTATKEQVAKQIRKFVAQKLKFAAKQEVS